MDGGKRRKRDTMVAESLEARRLMTAKLTSIPLPPTLTSPYGSSLERALAVDPSGGLWFQGATTVSGAEAIGELTAGGAVASYPLANTVPMGQMTAGPDGAIWFDAAGAIGRISATGAVTSFPLASPYSPSGIATGSDGDLWFLDGDGLHIDRMTTTGQMTQFAAPSGGSLGLGGEVAEEMTRAADGNVWYLANETPGNRGPRPPRSAVSLRAGRSPRSPSGRARGRRAASSSTPSQRAPTATSGSPGIGRVGSPSSGGSPPKARSRSSRSRPSPRP